MLLDDIETLQAKSTFSQAVFKSWYPEVEARVVAWAKPLGITDWREMKYVYMNQLTECPVCQICGKPVEFRTMNKGYKATCSRECDLQLKSQSHKKLWSNYTEEEKQTRLEQAADAREEHTGYRSPFLDPEIRKKIDETMLERYGTTRYISEEGRQRIAESHAEHRDEINEKIIKSWSAKSVEEKQAINSKRDETCTERFGIDNYSKTKEFHNFMSKKSKSLWQDPNWREKVKNTNLERYGVLYTCLAKHVQDSNGKQISRSNKDFVELLKNSGITDFEYEFSLKKYSYDVKVGDLLIEINPSYTHNSTIGPYFHGKHLSPKDRYYHRDKSKFAEENGYRCIHVWDWDQIEKIVYMLYNRERIFARNCEVREVDLDTTNEFLNLYHLQNTCRNQEFRLGLYYNNELVEIMTFGTPRFNHNYQWELLRLCTRPDYVVVGGANKLFNYFIEHYNPSSIISYCDDSKFSGNVYTHLGMIYKTTSNPSCHWYNIKTKRHISDSLLRQRGADQLLGTTDGKGTSNSEIMIREGFVEVYDCGQSTYIWQKP